MLTRVGTSVVVSATLFTMAQPPIYPSMHNSHTHTHTHTHADYDIILTLTYLHLATLPTWRPQGCPQLLFTPGRFQLMLLRMLLHPEAPPPPHTHSLHSASLFCSQPASQAQASSTPHVLPAVTWPPAATSPKATRSLTFQLCNFSLTPTSSSSATSAWHQRRYLHDLKKCFYTSKWRKFHVQRQRMSSPQIC